MAATAIDAPFTVTKQHGFVVRESPAAQRYVPPRGAAGSGGFDPSSPAGGQPRQRQAAAREEEPPLGGGGSGGSGLSRAALGLAGAAGGAPHDYGVSPGLPSAGQLRLAEFSHLTPGVKRLMRSVVRGLKAHQDPEAATEGLGGTYFFRNEAGAKVAIMKPCDEEPLAPNNPKGFVGRQLGDPGLKPTVRVGEAASREVAAYLLDHGHFAKVPHTLMVRMSHPVFHTAAGAPLPGGDCGDGEEGKEGGDGGDSGALPLKLGSLQEFAPHECDTSEMGASRFSVRDVQRIGILDVRLYNTDRHAGNILVRRAHAPSAHSSSARLLDASAAAPDLPLRYELVPIDHGFALPEGLEPPYFEWQHWPQAMMPFGAEELEYIAALDPRADADLLRRELPGLREESLRLLEVSTTLLKRCAAAGLTLAEIAGVVTRPLIGLDDEPSELESICYAVREDVDAALAAAGGGEAEAGRDASEEEDGLSDVEEADGEGSRAAGDGGGSPPSAFSAATHFSLRPPTSGSDASRLADDALFSMDEDGSRTPGAVSPTAAAAAAAAALSRVRTAVAAPGLAVKRSGELATPGAVVGMSFCSALASASADSLLAPSYESADSPRTQPTHAASAATPAASLDSTSAGLDAAFAPGAASYAPAGFATAARSRGRRGAQGRGHAAAGTHGRLHKAGGGGVQAYPPLVEPRAGGDAVFSGLSHAQWAEFMRGFNAAVDAALRCGAWRQAPGGGGTAMMSCPRF